MVGKATGPKGKPYKVLPKRANNTSHKSIYRCPPQTVSPSIMETRSRDIHIEAT